MGTRLFTFAISHFSEKARWGLDLNGVAYDERQLVLGLHIPIIRRRAPKTTVPVLERDGEVVQGSSAILDYLEQRLGKARLAVPEAQRARGAELEALADRAFGLGTQRVFYAFLLESPREVIDLWAQSPLGGARIAREAAARALYRGVFPLLGRAVRRTYKIRPEKVDEAKDLYRRAFDETDRALASQPYLLGDTLSRVDVTVAALLAPLCRPKEHMLRWPDTIPPSLLDFSREFEGRPTWDFVLRMYRHHRRG